MTKTSQERPAVFRDLVLVYSFNKPFRGKTRVLADFSWLGNKLAAMQFKPDHPGERVMLEKPTFEGKFEVYSTDQVEARYLLTPRFMERLTQLTGHSGDLRNVRLPSLAVIFRSPSALTTTASKAGASSRASSSASAPRKSPRNYG